MSPDRRTRGLRWFLVAVVAVVGMAAGCSDDPSAEEQVCDARSELRDALDQVATDVKAANFGDASDDLSQVGEAYDGLVSAVDDLAQEQRDALAPQVDALKSDITALTDAQSLDDLRTGLDTVVSQAQTIYDEIANTLSCD
jgi:outer membrane murein-binding lipoprotein Lpp